MTGQYDLPESIDEIFEDTGGYYSFRDYDFEMDNNQSMQFFIEHVAIDSENIIEDNGTQILLKHENYNFNIQVDAGGLGDFYSHKFECSKVEKGSE